MRKYLLPYVSLLLSATVASAGSFGPGPWANSTYYPGNLDGKYQAAVTGVNTTGVLGFAIRDGAPPFLQIETQSLNNNALISDTIAVNQDIQLDNSLNYFAIFVNGRTYVGQTAAGVNYNNSTVTGTLIGTQPGQLSTTNNVVTQSISTQLITNVTTTNQSIIVTNNGVVTRTNVTYGLTNVETVQITNSFTNSLLNSTLVATGVDGGFRAKIQSKTAVFTFKGNGQLTAPGPLTNNQQVNQNVAFTLNGLRVSFSGESTFQNLGGPAAPAVP